ncbi:hypothetical protein [Nocardioides sp.]|uniref:hypothetical protein n=1 Tax=Nocardioides sp. TaxID=35761 RepID=UPI003D15243F
MGRRTFAVALAAGAVVSGVQVARLWPRLATWGATDQEVLATMAGDDLVGEPRYRSTHAVTIGAPPEAVWPWLVQIGQGRGGLYSYDWLENLLGLDIHSANSIDPRLQELAVGDVVRLVPEGTQPPLQFVVLDLKAPALLLLGPAGTRDEAFAAQLPYPFWTFQLTPHGLGNSRLVVRFQADYEPTRLGDLAYQRLLRPVHFVMERKMLLGIRQRAECSVTLAPHLSVSPA